jgi:hypothetical protein
MPEGTPQAAGVRLAMNGRITVGWWFGTPRYAPFFRAVIHDLAPATD